MNDNDLRKLLKKLQFVMRCPNCGKPYHLEEISIRGFIDQNYFLNMDCSNCHIPVFATIAVSGDSGGITEPRFEGDFEENLSNKLPSQTELPPITNDEILNMHTFLEDFDGDFLKHFN
ncbi:MAG: hypothetical protein ABH837_01430 [bacterium]